MFVAVVGRMAKIQRELSLKAIAELESKTYGPEVACGLEDMAEDLERDNEFYMAMTRGHIAGYLQTERRPGYTYINDIVGTPASVLPMITAFLTREFSGAGGGGINRDEVLIKAHLRKPSVRLIEGMKKRFEGLTVSDGEHIPGYFDDGEDAVYVVMSVRKEFFDNEIIKMHCMVHTFDHSCVSLPLDQSGFVSAGVRYIRKDILALKDKAVWLRDAMNQRNADLIMGLTGGEKVKLVVEAKMQTRPDQPQAFGKTVNTLKTKTYPGIKVIEREVSGDWGKIDEFRNYMRDMELTTDATPMMLVDLYCRDIYTAREVPARGPMYFNAWGVGHWMRHTFGYWSESKGADGIMMSRLHKGFVSRLAGEVRSVRLAGTMLTGYQHACDRRGRIDTSGGMPIIYRNKVVGALNKYGRVERFTMLHEHDYAWAARVINNVRRTYGDESSQIMSDILWRAVRNQEITGDRNQRVHDVLWPYQQLVEIMPKIIYPRAGRALFKELDRHPRKAEDLVHGLQLLQERYFLGRMRKKDRKPRRYEYNRKRFTNKFLEQGLNYMETLVAEDRKRQARLAAARAKANAAKHAKLMAELGFDQPGVQERFDKFVARMNVYASKYTNITIESFLKVFGKAERVRQVIEGEYKGLFEPRTFDYDIREELGQLLKAALGNRGKDALSNAPFRLYGEVRQFGDIKEMCAGNIDPEHVDAICEALHRYGVPCDDLLEMKTLRAVVEPKCSPEFLVAGDASVCCMTFGAWNAKQYANERGFGVLNIYYKDRIIANSVLWIHDRSERAELIHAIIRGEVDDFGLSDFERKYVDDEDLKMQDKLDQLKIDTPMFEDCKSVLVLDNVEVAQNYTRLTDAMKVIYRQAVTALMEQYGCGAAVQGGMYNDLDLFTSDVKMKISRSARDVFNPDFYSDTAHGVAIVDGVPCDEEVVKYVLEDAPAEKYRHIPTMQPVEAIPF